MSKRLLFLLPVLFLLSACGAHKKTAAPPNPALPLENALLWEITGKGLKKPSYLFGTIHIVAEKEFFWPAKTTDCLLKCTRLTMELDMGKQLEMAFQMMALAPMKNGQKLADLLAPEDYRMVKEYFETEVAEVRMSGFSLFENYKPFILGSMLYTKMIEGPTKSYEMEFLTLAKGKLETGGLETVADQMGIFDQIPYAQQADGLLEMVRALKSGENAPGEDPLGGMVRLYREQNVDSLYLSSIAQEDLQGFEDKLLHDRNRNWIPVIGAMAKEKPTFFAVGAGHLGGPQGVIRLLRQAGYTLRPVR
jgi:uncharacterized protein YbaP (TraB family)